MPYAVPSVPALGTWAPPPAERGPSLESIYLVSSSINNKIISLKNYLTTASWGPLKKTLGLWARAQCAHWLRRP